MRKLIEAEWLKVRRCQILLVGIVGLALCPLLQYGSNQIIMAPELRDPNFDFEHLFNSVIWGNTQLFLPISLVMTGGWFIDRERSHDTLKNIVTVPVPMRALLLAKLIVTGALALLFGLYSAVVTLAEGVAFGLPGLSLSLALKCSAQVTAAALTTYLVCTPLILLFGRMKGAYLGGSILTFFLGYSMLFFKNGMLASAYPFSAALIWVGFDMEAYNGAKTAPNIALAAVGIGAMVLAAAVLLELSGRRWESGAPRRETYKAKGRGGRRKP